MKQEQRWLWRYRWGRKMVTSAVHMTEEQALKAHADAVRVEGSERVFEVPETAQELHEAWRRTDTSRPG